MPRVFGRRCPGCGGELPHRPTGRPPTYCSKACRQAAHRARRRAAAAAEGAHAAHARAQRALTGLSEADRDLSRLADDVFGAGPAALRTAVWSVRPDRWQEPVPTGWENALAAAAERLANRAVELAAAARAHARAAADQDHALTAAGIRRGQAAPPAGDETPSATPAAAPGRQTAGAVGEGVDRDELFDAIDDLLIWADRGELGQGLAAALDRLAAAFDAAAGNGPLDGLLAAAAAVREAARAVPDVPPDAAALIARLDAFLPATR